MAKLTVDFKQLEEMSRHLEHAGGDLKKVTETALEETFNLVTPQLKSTIKPHQLTGATEGSLRTTAQVRWEGMTAYVPVGFDISHGGLASIFLMYGTPKMSPDKKLYNAIYGSATRKKVRDAQKKVFSDAIVKLYQG